MGELIQGLDHPSSTLRSGITKGKPKKKGYYDTSKLSEQDRKLFNSYLRNNDEQKQELENYKYKYDQYPLRKAQGSFSTIAPDDVDKVYNGLKRIGYNSRQDLNELRELKDREEAKKKFNHRDVLNEDERAALGRVLEIDYGKLGIIDKNSSDRIDNQIKEKLRLNNEIYNFKKAKGLTAPKYRKQVTQPTEKQVNETEKPYVDTGFRFYEPQKATPVNPNHANRQPLEAEPIMKGPMGYQSDLSSDKVASPVTAGYKPDISAPELSKETVERYFKDNYKEATKVKYGREFTYADEPAKFHSYEFKKNWVKQQLDKEKIDNEVYRNFTAPAYEIADMLAKSYDKNTKTAVLGDTESAKRNINKLLREYLNQHIDGDARYNNQNIIDQITAYEDKETALFSKPGLNPITYMGTKLLGNIPDNVNKAIDEYQDIMNMVYILDRHKKLVGDKLSTADYDLADMTFRGTRSFMQGAGGTLANNILRSLTGNPDIDITRAVDEMEAVSPDIESAKALIGLGMYGSGDRRDAEQTFLTLLQRKGMQSAEAYQTLKDFVESQDTWNKSFYDLANLTGSLIGELTVGPYKWASKAITSGTKAFKATDFYNKQLKIEKVTDNITEHIIKNANKPPVAARMKLVGKMLGGKSLEAYGTAIPNATTMMGNAAGRVAHTTAAMFASQMINTGFDVEQATMAARNMGMLEFFNQSMGRAGFAVYMGSRLFKPMLMKSLQNNPKLAQLAIQKAFNTAYMVGSFPAQAAQIALRRGIDNETDLLGNRKGMFDIDKEFVTEMILNFIMSGNNFYAGRQYAKGMDYTKKQLEMYELAVNEVANNKDKEIAKIVLNSDTPAENYQKIAEEIAKQNENSKAVKGAFETSEYNEGTGKRDDILNVVFQTKRTVHDMIKDVTKEDGTTEIKSVLPKIKEYAYKDPMTAKIYDLMEEHLPDVQVLADENVSLGTYRKSDNTIRLSDSEIRDDIDGQNFANIMLHEGFHALLGDRYDKDPSFKESVDMIHGEFVDYWNKLSEGGKKYNNIADIVYNSEILEKPEEFLAALWDKENKALREQLQRVTPGVSLWQRVKNTIANMPILKNTFAKHVDRYSLVAKAEQLLEETIGKPKEEPKEESDILENDIDNAFDFGPLRDTDLDAPQAVLQDDAETIKHTKNILNKYGIKDLVTEESEATETVSFADRYYVKLGYSDANHYFKTMVDNANPYETIKRKLSENKQYKSEDIEKEALRQSNIVRKTQIYEPLSISIIDFENASNLSTVSITENYNDRGDNVKFMRYKPESVYFDKFMKVSIDNYGKMIQNKAMYPHFISVLEGLKKAKLTNVQSNRITKVSSDGTERNVTDTKITDDYMVKPFVRHSFLRKGYYLVPRDDSGYNVMKIPGIEKIANSGHQSIMFNYESTMANLWKYLGSSLTWNHEYKPKNIGWFADNIKGDKLYEKVVMGRDIPLKDLFVTPDKITDKQLEKFEPVYQQIAPKVKAAFTDSFGNEILPPFMSTLEHNGTRMTVLDAARSYTKNPDVELGKKVKNTLKEEGISTVELVNIALDDIMTWGVDGGGGSRAITIKNDKTSQMKNQWKYANTLMGAEANQIWDAQDMKIYLKDALDEAGRYNNTLLETDYGMVGKNKELWANHFIADANDFIDEPFLKNLLGMEPYFDAASIIVKPKYSKLLSDLYGNNDSGVFKPKYHETDADGNVFMYKTAYFTPTLNEDFKQTSPKMYDFLTNMANNGIAVVTFTTASKGKGTYKPKQVVNENKIYQYDTANRLINILDQNGKVDNDAYEKYMEEYKAKLYSGKVPRENVKQIKMSGKDGLLLINAAHNPKRSSSPAFINSVPQFNRQFDLFQKEGGQEIFDIMETWENRAIKHYIGDGQGNGFIESIFALRSLYDKVKENTYNKPKTVSSKVTYQGGYENVGKGTPMGDGKDKAMRKVADGFIGEYDSNRLSSSRTSAEQLGFKPDSKNIMLARNGTLNGKPLQDATKQKIANASKQGAKFVVGDMPGVDTPFMDYLDEIGAEYTIYHTGDKPRVTREQQTKSKPQVTEAELKAVNRVVRAIYDDIKNSKETELGGQEDYIQLYGKDNILKLLESIFNKDGTVNPDAFAPMLLMGNMLAAKQRSQSGSATQLMWLTRNAVSKARKMNGRGVSLKIAPNLNNKVEILRLLRHEAEKKYGFAVDTEGNTESALILNQDVLEKAYAEHINPETNTYIDFGLGKSLPLEIIEKYNLKYGDKIFEVYTPSDDLHAIVPRIVTGISEDGTTTSNSAYLELVGKDYDLDASGILLPDKNIYKHEEYISVWEYFVKNNMHKGIYKQNANKYKDMAKTLAGGNTFEINNIVNPLNGEKVFAPKDPTILPTHYNYSQMIRDAHVAQGTRISVRNALSYMLRDPLYAEQMGFAYDGKPETSELINTINQGMVDTYDITPYDVDKSIAKYFSITPENDVNNLKQAIFAGAHTVGSMERAVSFQEMQKSVFKKSGTGVYSNPLINIYKAMPKEGYGNGTDVVAMHVRNRIANKMMNEQKAILSNIPIELSNGERLVNVPRVINDAFQNYIRSYGKVLEENDGVAFTGELFKRGAGFREGGYKAILQGTIFKYLIDNNPHSSNTYSYNAIEPEYKDQKFLYSRNKDGFGQISTYVGKENKVVKLKDLFDDNGKVTVDWVPPSILGLTQLWTKFPKGKNPTHSEKYRTMAEAVANVSKYLSNETNIEPNYLFSLIGLTDFDGKRMNSYAQGAKGAPLLPLNYYPENLDNKAKSNLKSFMLGDKNRQGMYEWINNTMLSEHGKNLVFANETKTIREMSNAIIDSDFTDIIAGAKQKGITPIIKINSANEAKTIQDYILDEAVNESREMFDFANNVKIDTDDLDAPFTILGGNKDYDFRWKENKIFKDIAKLVGSKNALGMKHLNKKPIHKYTDEEWSFMTQAIAPEILKVLTGYGKRFNKTNQEIDEEVHSIMNNLSPLALKILENDIRSSAPNSEIADQSASIAKLQILADLAIELKKLSNVKKERPGSSDNYSLSHSWNPVEILKRKSANLKTYNPQDIVFSTYGLRNGEVISEDGITADIVNNYTIGNLAINPSLMTKSSIPMLPKQLINHIAPLTHIGSILDVARGDIIESVLHETLIADKGETNVHVEDIDKLVQNPDFMNSEVYRSLLKNFSELDGTGFKVELKNSITPDESYFYYKGDHYDYNTNSDLSKIVDRMLDDYNKELSIKLLEEGTPEEVIADITKNNESMKLVLDTFIRTKIAALRQSNNLMLMNKVIESYISKNGLDKMHRAPHSFESKLSPEERQTEDYNRNSKFQILNNVMRELKLAANELAGASPLTLLKYSRKWTGGTLERYKWVESNLIEPLKERQSVIYDRVKRDKDKYANIPYGKTAYQLAYETIKGLAKDGKYDLDYAATEIYKKFNEHEKLKNNKEIKRQGILMIKDAFERVGELLGESSEIAPVYKDLYNALKNAGEEGFDKTWEELTPQQKIVKGQIAGIKIKRIHKQLERKLTDSQMFIEWSDDLEPDVKLLLNKAKKIESTVDDIIQGADPTMRFGKKEDKRPYYTYGYSNFSENIESIMQRALRTVEMVATTEYLDQGGDANPLAHFISLGLLSQASGMEQIYNTKIDLLKLKNEAFENTDKVFTPSMVEPGKDVIVTSYNPLGEPKVIKGKVLGIYRRDIPEEVKGKEIKIDYKGPMLSVISKDNVGKNTLFSINLNNITSLVAGDSYGMIGRYKNNKHRKLYKDNARSILENLSKYDKEAGIKDLYKLQVDDKSDLGLKVVKLADMATSSVVGMAYLGGRHLVEAGIGLGLLAVGEWKLGGTMALSGGVGFVSNPFKKYMQNKYGVIGGISRSPIPINPSNADYNIVKKLRNMPIVSNLSTLKYIVSEKDANPVAKNISKMVTGRMNKNLNEFNQYINSIGGIDNAINRKAIKQNRKVRQGLVDLNDVIAGISEQYRGNVEVIKEHAKATMDRLAKKGLLSEIVMINDVPVPIVNNRTLSDMDMADLSLSQIAMWGLSFGGWIGRLESMSTKNAYNVSADYIRDFEKEWRGSIRPGINSLPEQLVYSMADRLVYKNIGFYGNKTPWQQTKTGSLGLLFGRFMHEKFVDQTRGVFDRAKYYQGIMGELRKDKDFVNMMGKYGLPVGDWFLPNWKREIAQDVAIGGIKIGLSRVLAYHLMPSLIGAWYQGGADDILDTMKQYVGFGTSFMGEFVAMLASCIMSMDAAHGDVIEPIAGEPKKLGKQQIKAINNYNLKLIRDVMRMPTGYGFSTIAEAAFVFLYLAAKEAYDRARYEYGTADITREQMEEASVKMLNNAARYIPGGEIISQGYGAYYELNKESSK